MEECLSQLITPEKKKYIYILNFQHTKAFTGVTSFDGFYLVVVNNTLLAMNIFISS